MDPRKLKNWFEVAGGPLLGIGTFFGAIAGAVRYIVPFLEGIGLGAGPAMALAVSVAVIVAAVSLWGAYRAVVRTSRLLRPERFDLRVRRPEDLMGRERDVEDLRALVRSTGLVFVDGESGSGKSSIIRYGLVPQLRESSDVLPVLISEYGGDWQDGVTKALYEAILAELTDSQRLALSLSDRAAVGAVTISLVDNILNDIALRLGRVSVLIFDQFDDYQLAHRSEFLDEHQAWINAQQLRAKNCFWDTVDAARTLGRVKIVFVTRSDASLGLHSVRFAESAASRTVTRLDALWIPRILNQIAADDGKGPVIQDPDDGWEDLKRLLGEDLGSRSMVLPQQARIVLLGLRKLRTLTPREYRRAGRATGVEGLYIRDALRSASTLSGSSEAQLNVMLLLMTERGAENEVKTRRQSLDQLSAAISPESLRLALDQLARDEIVRPAQTSEEAREQWQLDHDYLARSIVEEQRRANRLASSLREAAIIWEETGVDLSQRYRTLLPLGTQAALLWSKLRSPSEFSYRPYGRYALISLLRALPLVVAISGLGGWWLWTRTQEYQIERLIGAAPNIKTSLGTDGRPLWGDALALAGRLNEALHEANVAPAGEVRASMLAKIAQRTAERGDLARTDAILRDAMKAAHDAPKNVRMGVYGSILQGIAAVARTGNSEEVNSLLETVRVSELTKIPEGNNRVYVALRMVRLYRAAGNAKQALELVRSMLPEIDQRLAAEAAIELHRLGDGDDALALLVRFTQGQPTNSHAMRGEEPLNQAGLADAYRILGRYSEASAQLQKAVDSALAMSGVRTSDQAREYVTYFNFGFQAAEFARYLVRGKRPDVISAVASREGDVLTRVNVYAAAAVESYHSSSIEDYDRFLEIATKEARGAADPVLRAQGLLSLATETRDENKTSAAEAYLSEAIVAAREAPEIYQAADRVDGAQEKLGLFTSLALLAEDLQPVSQSRRLAHETEEISRRTTEDPSYYLPKLAEALARSGDFMSARQVAERVRDGDEELQAFALTLNGITFYQHPDLLKRIRNAQRADAMIDQ